ncbi:hypothetical protein [Vibrio tritonius]|uniref:hypothetical protein n=1 Tax=Vibrio tritonius TaxID=1435069 RepID=UPI00315DAF76
MNNHYKNAQIITKDGKQVLVTIGQKPDGDNLIQFMFCFNNQVKRIYMGWDGTLQAVCDSEISPFELLAKQLSLTNKQFLSGIKPGNYIYKLENQYCESYVLETPVGGLSIVFFSPWGECITAEKKQTSYRQAVEMQLMNRIFNNSDDSVKTDLLLSKQLLQMKTHSGFFVGNTKKWCH